MTGYGEGRSQDEKTGIYLQIKTLNNRFLVIEIHSSQSIPFSWEKDIKQNINEIIKRGKVIIDIEIIRKEPPLAKIMINQTLASHYYNILTKISDNSQNGECDINGNKCWIIIEKNNF